MTYSALLNNAAVTPCSHAPGMTAMLLTFAPFGGAVLCAAGQKFPGVPHFLSHLFRIAQQCGRDTLPPRARGDRHVADVRHFLPPLFNAAGQPLGRRVVAQCVHHGGADDLQCIEIGAQACEEGRNLEWMVNKAKGIEEEVWSPRVSTTAAPTICSASNFGAQA